MKILIVDDDLNTVDAIAESVDWQMIRIDKVLRAYSVNRAKQIVEAEHPEIILCDIEMPGADGIDFLKWIRRENIVTEFIFLTCHDNFDFAYEAIEYGAIGYVMKPFNIEKTVPVILKAIARATHDKSISEYKRYGQYVEKNRRQLIEKFWDDVMRERDETAVAEMILNVKSLKIEIDADAEYRLFMACAAKLEDEAETYMPYMLQNVVSELILGDAEALDSVTMEIEGKNCVILILKNRKDLKTLRSKADHLISIIKRYLRRTVNCYIGENYDVFHLAAAREKVVDWCQETAVGKGEVFQEGSMRDGVRSEMQSLNQEQYKVWLEEGNQIAIIRGLRSRMDELNLDKKGDFSVILHDYMQVVYAVLAHYGMQAHVFFDDEVYKKLLKSANHSAVDFMKWGVYITDKTMTLVRDAQRDTNVIKQAKQFIAEHYGEDITRNEIAEAVSLTPDYLGKLFRKETGEYVNDYINKVRVKTAKEMLNEPDVNVSEVAMRVGFGSTSYFSTIFKKITDMTPNEYKKEIKKRKRQSRE